MDPFLLIGAIIVMGFISKWISERFNISEIIILMLFGVLIGPVFNLINATPGSAIYTIYPFMGGLALILILFDGGISIQVRALLRTLSRATLFTLTSFIFTIIATVIFGYVFHISLLYSVLMGAILGGTSSISILSMLGDTKLPSETKSLMTTESILTDILVIITVLIIIDYIAVPQLKTDQILYNLLAAVSISIIFGALTAYVWDKWMKNINVGNRYYISTLAVMFLLYSTSRYVHASGGLSVFVFAVTLANLNKVIDGDKTKQILSDKIRPIHSEIVFFTKTFFFTYIGILYPLYNISLTIILWSVLLTILYLIVRYLAYLLILARDRKKYMESLIVTMLPRGLAAAVMVGYVIDKGILIKNLLEIVFTVLFLTSLVGTVGLWIVREKQKKEEEIKEKENKVKPKRNGDKKDNTTKNNDSKKDNKIQQKDVAENKKTKNKPIKTKNKNNQSIKNVSKKSSSKK